MAVPYLLPRCSSASPTAFGRDCVSLGFHLMSLQQRKKEFEKLYCIENCENNPESIAFKFNHPFECWEKN